MLRSLAIIAGMMIFSQATASTFSYTYLQGEFGVLRLDEDLVVDGEVYEEFGVGAFSGAYQFDGGLVLGGSNTVATNNGPDTEVTISQFIIGGAIPVAISEQVDVVPEIGFIAAETEICRNDLCEKDDDNGVAYGVGLRAWAEPNKVEVSLGWHDSTLDDSESAISLGGAIWWLDAHSARLGISVQDTQTTTTVGYRYTWR